MSIYSVPLQFFFITEFVEISNLKKVVEVLVLFEEKQIEADTSQDKILLVANSIPLNQWHRNGRLL